MFVLLFIIQCTIYFLIFRRFYLQAALSHLQWIFVPGLIIKVIAGLSLGLLYTQFYQGGDTLAYYEDSVLLSHLFLTNPSKYFELLFSADMIEGLKYADQDRALLFSKLASLLSIFSLQNYWLMTVSISLFSFFCSWWFVLKLIRHLHVYVKIAAASFIFFPSVVFWSSGLLKESVSMSLIFILCGLFLELYFNRYTHIKSYLVAILMIFASSLLWLLKYYYAAVLLPLMLILLLFQAIKRYFKNLSALQQWFVGVTCFVLALGIFWGVMLSHPNLKPDSILQAIVKNHNLSVYASDNNGYIVFENLKPKVSSFLAHFPKAFISGLFRPLPGEGSTFLHTVAGIENLLVLSISLLALISIVKLRKITHPELVLICVVYVVLLSSLLSIASPNFGSLSRYKVAYAPFWLFMCLLSIADSTLFHSLFQSIKKIYTNIQEEK
ncbi:hypothetical protein OKW21_002458 [Catalinimonas alkaloidigena]|uniref:hypothetical protein n=1 Tax=Catalinimonas alkaloidigena TaxID=1075417 RepID=UPI0024063806|nr:hypothetical protein [Catalinimonas alkaloidigena]MDF9797195.1 hypothetical protein [Catalinimonas alkaloidigena]